MKKLIALVLILMFSLNAATAFAEVPAAAPETSKTLVVYFSATGSTERIAGTIAEESKADGVQCAFPHAMRDFAKRFYGTVGA